MVTESPGMSRRLVAQPEADLCLLLPEDFQLDDVGGV